MAGGGREDGREDRGLGNATADDQDRWAAALEGDVEPLWGEEDAQELKELVKKLGPRDPNLSSEAFIKPFFRELNLQRRYICELDADVGKFTKLTFLDVSQNPLTCIDALPPNLERLKAYNTKINSIACHPCPSLVFLGLGYSPVGTDALRQISSADRASSRFPRLLSLDICFTNVGDFAEAAEELKRLPELRHLCLAGSPVCLLPHYRMRFLNWLPELQLLDGVAVSEQEADDVQKIAIDDGDGVARISVVRLAMQPLKLGDLRSLLKAPAEVLYAARRRAESEAATAAAVRLSTERGEEVSPLVEEEAKDAIVEVCTGGIVRLRFELPGGCWEETADVELTAELAQACQDSGVEAFDVLELGKLRKPEDGPPLVFDIDVSSLNVFEVSDGDEDRLLEFCKWMRRGLAIQVLFRAAPPPTPEEMNGAADAALLAAVGAAGKGKDAKKGSPIPPKSPGPGEDAGDGEGVESGPAPLPEPELTAIGGALVPLDVFLWRGDCGVSAQQRQDKTMPSLPAPWTMEWPKIRVVPMTHWLEPNVQVPQAEKQLKKEWGYAGAPEGVALMGVKVVFYAEDGWGEDVEEDVDPALLDPKAKGKAKK
eukprot:TRINITY_DN16550_c0_g1_i1.p1 TRINITY_DN16550_c0_g1~~TRINITY_DN16550_c0_g1_i1.p1  ORF type:complete len:699 (-),score=155.40 TRINITY_DN16550_c0_g1_i1:283-2079(-)